MKTKLDHIYGNTGNGAVDAQIQALETRVTNLSNIAAKTNLAQTFSGIQTFQDGARSNATITNAKDLTTKEYVDNTIGNGTTLQSGSGNFKTTTLTGTKTSQFSRTGRYEFLIHLKGNNDYYNVNFILNITDVTKKYFTQNFLYTWGNVNNNAIQAVANAGFYMVYDNKSLKIIKVGQNQPEQCELTILYRGVK